MEQRWTDEFVVLQGRESLSWPRGCVAKFLSFEAKYLDGKVNCCQLPEWLCMALGYATICKDKRANCTFMGPAEGNFVEEILYNCILATFSFAQGALHRYEE